MYLALFDIDGTLITTHGAGMRAFYRAFDTLYGLKVEAGPIHPDGKTDPLILKELLEQSGLEIRWSEQNRELLFASYLSFLDEEMKLARDRGLIRILPGVRDLLEMLSGQPDFSIGLVTGNLEKGAGIKLKSAGLNGYFQFGGYGSDSEDRTILTRIGIQRGAQLINPAPVWKAFVIGDTPFDIIHGHAAGACVIAVASARFGLEDLGRHQPDLLVPDLTSARAIVDFMRSTA